MGSEMCIRDSNFNLAGVKFGGSFEPFSRSNDPGSKFYTIYYFIYTENAFGIAKKTHILFL